MPSVWWHSLLANGTSMHGDDLLAQASEMFDQKNLCCHSSHCSGQ